MQLTRWERLRGRAAMLAMALSRRMTLGVRIMVSDGEGVLLVRHSYTRGLYFPGGGVEPGETAEAAAARELVEETGYEATGRMRLFGFYHNVNALSVRDHVALYVVGAFAEARPFRPGFEIVERGWFPLDALPDDVEPGTRRRIGEVLSGGDPDPVW